MRWLTVKIIFTRRRFLRLTGRLLYLSQIASLQQLVRGARFISLLPNKFRELKPRILSVNRHFSDTLIREVATPTQRGNRVGLLTGCVQDLIYSNVHRDTGVDVLLVHDYDVAPLRRQFCCGSLHAHNGELELTREMAR